MLAGPSSPAHSQQRLRRAVFQTETAGRQRRARGSRSQPRNDPGSVRAAAPWPAAESFSGERGRGDWRPRFARELDGERAGRERKLTTALIRSENGSGRRFRAAGGKLQRRFLSARARTGAEARRGELGRRRRRAARSPLLIQARGGENLGAGFGLADQQREREIRGRRLGKGMNLTGGPHPSAAREGEGEGGKSAGPWHRKGRGVWAKMAEKKEGGERKAFSFLFSNKFFKLFSK